MDLEALQHHIQAGRFHPVYYFHGEEEYFIDQWARKLAKAALGDGDPCFNYSVFRDDEDREDRKGDRLTAMAREIVDASNSYPFISERRVSLVWNAGKVASVEPLAAYIMNPNPSTVLILVTGEEPKTSSKKTATKKTAKSFDVLAHLRDNGPRDCILEFRRFTQNDLAGWVVAELQRRGKSISHESAMLLVDIKDCSAREIAGEIEKIAVSLDDVREIEEQHILALCGFSKTYNVFQLSDALLARNAAAAMEIANTLLVSTELIAIIGVLFRQVSLLWSVFGKPVRHSISFQEAVALGFNSPKHYLATTRLVNRFRSMEEFRWFFESLLEADIAAKSGGDKSTCLALLIHKLCHPPKEAA